MQLFEILSHVWNSLPDSDFQSSIPSMTNRVEIVQKQRGRFTKY